MKYYYYYKTPIGEITIIATDAYLTDIEFSKVKTDYIYEETNFIKKVHNELMEYFDGTRKSFDIPLLLEGTDFQKSCWESLIKIPYGETRSYSDIAVMINNEKAVRAVGMANHNNRIPIIIPCHRVIGKNGSLVGFGGGLKIKEYLLNLERNK